DARVDGDEDRVVRLAVARPPVLDQELELPARAVAPDAEVDPEGRAGARRLRDPEPGEARRRRVARDRHADLDRDQVGRAHEATDAALLAAAARAAAEHEPLDGDRRPQRPALRPQGAGLAAREGIAHLLLAGVVVDQLDHLPRVL